MGSGGPQKLVTVVRSGLAGDVQHVRKQRDLSLEVVCDELGWQQSKLSRMENGHQCISSADLASLPTQPAQPCRWTPPHSSLLSRQVRSPEPQCGGRRLAGRAGCTRSGGAAGWS
jgi:hypothetical protein